VRDLGQRSYQPQTPVTPAAPPEPEIVPDLIHDPTNQRLLDGMLLTLRRGETRLIAFRFHRTTTGAEQYIFGSVSGLPKQWWDQERSSVTLSGQLKMGDLLFRVTVPKGAKPGDLTTDTFFVEYGKVGARQQKCSFRIQVIHAVAVGLQCPDPQKTIGVFGKSADFALTVTNSEAIPTAFRLGIKPLEQTASSASARTAAPQSDQIVLQDNKWFTLFDKEVEDVLADGGSQTVNFTVKRRPQFFQPLMERQKFRIASVPVTDASNAAKLDNFVEVEVKRLRLWFMPYWTLSAFAVLFLMIVGRTPSEFTVTNATYTDTPNADTSNIDTSKNVYWLAVPKGTGSVELTWSAFPLSWLKMEIPNSEGTIITPTSANYWFWRQARLDIKGMDFDKSSLLERTVSLRPRGVGGAAKIKIKAYLTRENAPLQVSVNDVVQEPNEEGEIALNMEPNEMSKIKLTNALKQTSRVEEDKIRLYKGHEPKSPYSVGGKLIDGNTLDPKQSTELKIQRNAAVEDKEDTLVILTSDSKLPKLTFRLKGKEAP